MFKSAFIAAAFAAVCSAAALPGAGDQELDGAQFHLITVCTAANFQGSCVQFVGPLNTCHYVDDYNDAISSAKVDDANIHCRLYEHGGCKGSNMLIDRPYNNFQDVTFNDMASSFTCWFA
jgi:hypothetical protein